MDKKLSLREALGIGFMFAFRNIGTIFLLFLIPITFIAVQGILDQYFQSAVVRFFIDLWLRWANGVFITLIILPMFLGIYRTGKPVYSISLSKQLLMRVMGITLINDIIMLNLSSFSFPLSNENIFILIISEILITAVFIFLLYPYVYFSSLFVIDEGLTVKESLMASHRIVNGHALYLFFVWLALVLLLALSILTIVGPFFVSAAMTIVFIHFYHVLQGREKEMVKLH